MKKFKVLQLKYLYAFHDELGKKVSRANIDEAIFSKRHKEIDEKIEKAKKKNGNEELEELMEQKKHTFNMWSNAKNDVSELTEVVKEIESQIKSLEEDLQNEPVDLPEYPKEIR